jgi:hypothetical protein
LYLARFSLTLNLTILLTRVSGRGLSRGNWIVPLDTLYGDSSPLNAFIGDEDGNKLT